MTDNAGGPRYLDEPPGLDLTEAQANVVGAMRAVLEDLGPAGVNPEDTVARLEPHPLTPAKDVLQLYIRHSADPDVSIEMMVEPWGAIWFSSPPLGPDFSLSYNNVEEPAENVGDTKDAQELLRELLEGRVEARLRFFGDRLIRTKFVGIDPDGRRRGQGVYYHVPNMPLALRPGGRTEVLRPNYLDPRSPYSSEDKP